MILHLAKDRVPCVREAILTLILQEESKTVMMVNDDGVDKKTRRLYGMKKVVYEVRHDPDREIQKILQSNSVFQTLVNEYIQAEQVQVEEGNISIRRKY